jgi:hypothetical protein
MERFAQVKCCRQPALPLVFRTLVGATGKSASSTRFAAGCAIGLANPPRPKNTGKSD